MSLRAFIRDNHEKIISEFAAFARTLMPPGVDMTEPELRDHADQILLAVVDDICTPQAAEEQSLKSRGRSSAKIMEASGRLHADDRILHRFTFRSVLAEFRALRATVLRLHEQSGESDLADVRRFNEAIDEAMTESMDRFAGQTDRFRDQFIGVLGHDLRTPLGAVTAGAALLAIPEDNPERRLRIVPRIINSAQRMERLIADLLASVEAILPIWHWRDPGSHRSCRICSPTVQHGGGSAITLTAQEQGDGVTLTVHNGGPPIPQDALPSIFEPLARGAIEGTSHSIGLGLFIARAIVTAHGGDIQVSSSTEAGTTFTVGLPKAR